MTKYHNFQISFGCVEVKLSFHLLMKSVRIYKICLRELLKALAKWSLWWKERNHGV